MDRTDSVVDQRLLASHIISRITVTELLVWAITVYGCLLGVLKRLLASSEAVALGFDMLCIAALLYLVARRPVALGSRRLILQSMPILAFCFYCAVATLRPDTSLSTALVGWRFLCFGMLGFFIGRLHGLGCSKSLGMVRVIIACSVIAAVYATIQHFRGYSSAELEWIQALPATMRIAGTGKYRLMGTLGSGVDLALLLSLSIPITLSLAVYVPSGRLPLLLGFILMIYVLAFTYVRAAWISTLIACITVIAGTVTSHSRYQQVLPFLILALVALAMITPLLLTTAIDASQDAALRQRIASLAHPLEDPSMHDRLETWSQVWRAVEENPLGIGLGATGATRVKQIGAFQSQLTITDNSYLKVLLETGWPGLGLFILTLLGGLATLSSTMKELEGRWRGLSLGVFASLSGFAFLLLFGEYVELNPGRTFLWMLLGIGTGLAQNNVRQHKEVPVS